MSNSIFRSLLDALMPPGSVWNPKTDGDLDKLLEGISVSSDYVITALSDLANIRNPYKTTMLADMEEEYGIRSTTKKTDSERRAGLAAAITGGAIDGSIDTLQDKLDQAGFNVTVYANSPPVDPASIVAGITAPIICGAANAVCGGVGVVCGGTDNAYLLVNGEAFDDYTYFDLPSGNYHYLTACGDPPSLVCGATDLVCGSRYSENSYWGMIFFVGGEATYEYGLLTSIEAAEVPFVRKDEFKQLILKYKPMHSWCVLIISLT
jgi:hypothetical protein